MAGLKIGDRDSLFSLSVCQAPVMEGQGTSLAAWTETHALLADHLAGVGGLPSKPLYLGSHLLNTTPTYLP